MTDNNNASKPSETPQAPATIDKPDVPTPAGPIGSLPLDYTTHGLNPKNMVRITEEIRKWNSNNLKNILSRYTVNMLW